MMPQKTWREIYGESAEQKAGLLLQWKIDDTERVGGYINVVTPQYIKGKTLLFDIAPSIDKMTAYRDAGIEYGDWRGIKKGACQFTLELGKLSPGKHTVSFWIMNYGEKPVQGSFEIEGADYGSYTKLHEQIKTEITEGRTLPPAQMTDKAREATMVKLLKNAGWSDVLKLNIVDKDWWIDRASGGDSAVVSRHMAAAAAYKDADNKHYYKTCTFHEQMLITGGFGPLELTHQSLPVPISAKSLGVTEKAATGPDMSAVAQDGQPDFSKPDAVLADIERMRKEALKKRAFLLVGKCSSATNRIGSAVERNPQGYQAEVKRMWLEIYEEYKKIP